jgi:hypothetical protein
MNARSAARNSDRPRRRRMKSSTHGPAISVIGLKKLGSFEQESMIRPRLHSRLQALGV